MVLVLHRNQWFWCIWTRQWGRQYERMLSKFRHLFASFCVYIHHCSGLDLQQMLRHEGLNIAIFIQMGWTFLQMDSAIVGNALCNSIARWGYLNRLAETRYRGSTTTILPSIISGFLSIFHVIGLLPTCWKMESTSHALVALGILVVLHCSLWIKNRITFPRKCGHQCNGTVDLLSDYSILLYHVNFGSLCHSYQGNSIY